MNDLKLNPWVIAGIYLTGFLIGLVSHIGVTA